MNFLKCVTLLGLASTLSATPIFETVEYCDSKDTVIEKLEACPRVEGEYVNSMFGETKIDDCYKITQKLGAAQFSLKFAWNDNEELKRLDLRSQLFSNKQYGTELKQSYDAAVRLISRNHGKPAIANVMPETSQLKVGGVTVSHVWQLEEGSLILGIGENEGEYDLLIRFNQERVGQ